MTPPRTNPSALCLLLCCTLLPAAAVPPTVQDPSPSPSGTVEPAELKRLAWLAGTWVLRDGDKTTEEHWRPLQGTTLLGSSHTYDATRTVFFEHLRITAMRGTIAYVAMPGGGKPTVFPVAKIDDGVVEFENATHDHPQRIRYEKTAAGITATISQLDGSRAQAFVFAKAPVAAVETGGCLRLRARPREGAAAAFGADQRVEVVVVGPDGRLHRATGVVGAGGTARALGESLRASLQKAGCAATCADGDPAADPLQRAMHQVVVLPDDWRLQGPVQGVAGAEFDATIERR